MNAYLARIRPDRFTLLLIAIAVIGAGLVLARQVTYGPSLHSDSVQHLSAARGLLAGDGLISAAGVPYEWWPPLFPMLLAAGSLGVFDPLDVAGPLNAVCFGLTVFVIACWLRRHLRSRFLIVWGSLALAVAIPVTWIASWVMSEAPFILFTVLALALTSAFPREPRRSTLLWAAVFTALAWLTRYIGIAVVVTVVLMLLFQRDAPPTRKARRILGYGLISSFPMILFLIRNYIAVGNLTTSRQVVDYSLPDILERTAFFFGGWAGLYRTGGDIDETIRISLAIILLIVIGFLVLMLHRNPEERERWRMVYPFVLFIPIFYTIHILGMFRGNTHHGLQERHIIPIFVMNIPVFLTVLDGVVRTGKEVIPSVFPRIPAFRGMIFVGIIFTLSGWIGYGIHVNQEEIQRYNSPDNRYGYQAAMYVDSDLIEFIIHSFPKSGWVTGNFHTEVIHIYTQIHSRYSTAPHSYDDLVHLFDNTGEMYLIWSTDPDLDTDYSLDDLHAMPSLDIVGTFRDGVVFQNFSHPERIWDTYDAIISKTPIIHSEITIYLDDRTILYTAEMCDDSRVSPRFFLHIEPEDSGDLHSSRKKNGFDNIDFSFRDGPRYDPTRCMRSVLLPDYPIVGIRTGQYDESGEIWSEDYSFAFSSLEKIWSTYDSILAENPIIRSAFTIYLNRTTLLYVPDICEDSRIDPRFFLHIDPKDTNDLDASKKQYGFDNIDFAFKDGPRYDPGRCMRSVLLPDYPIIGIRTGQYDETGELWSAEYSFTD